MHTPNDRDTWGPRAAQAYATACVAIRDGQYLVRRISDAERAHYEIDSPASSMFPDGVEPIKVFSIDQRFRFGSQGRNWTPGAYDVTMLIPIAPRLEDFLRDHFYPDQPDRGRVPAQYRENPAFKVEHGETTVVIRRQGWDEFWRHVDDVEYVPGYHTYGGATGF